MQRVIREEFPHHTIISIAHKLDSILDYDRVVLLEDGSLKEFDNPQTLLASPASAFHKLYNSYKAEQEEVGRSKRIGGNEVEVEKKEDA